jgi:HEAT repeat protein
MVALNVVGRFRHQNELRSYRRELAAEVTQNLALRLLPALIETPLPIVDAYGMPYDLSAGLRKTPRLTLSGVSGSGRWLALQQLAYHWASSEIAPALIPALFPLSRLDDERSPPEALLAAWSQPSGQAAAPKRGAFSRLRLGAAPREPAGQSARWLLLIYGWEDLPAERRAAWRSALVEAPRLWPELGMAIVLPKDEAAWPGFTPTTIPRPASAVLADWVGRLAPPQQRAALLAALAPGAPLYPLSERLTEVALLAWLASDAGLPATRAELYAQALERALDLLPTQQARAKVYEELQLLAAYGELPSFKSPLLLEDADGAMPRFIHPQLRRYLAARQIVEEGCYDLLHSLDQAERDELALLIATMLVDPTPLYAALWNGGRLRPRDAMVLGRCLRERTPASPSWALRVIGALARLAHDGAPTLHAEALVLLAATMPILDATLPSVGDTGEPLEQPILRLLDTLPAALAAPRLELLAYGDATPEGLAWKLADRLVDQPTAEDRPPPADRAALARWTYVQAARGAHSRQLLTTAVATTALPALAESQAGDERRLRAGAALLGDGALPAGTHMLALALLVGNQHPSALTIIERAIHNDSVEIRQAAIAALANHDPDDVFPIVHRTALDGTVPWDTRLSAIQRLGDHLASGAGAALRQCASDSALPLYARMRAVAALGQDQAAMADLVAIVSDTTCHPEVRAVAARLLGATRYHPALDDLLQFLTDRETPSSLAEAICDALGAMGSGHGHEARVRYALIHTLEISTTDVRLTLAAVRAIGLLGDADAVETLIRLLGAEALARLQHGPHAPLLQEPAEACLSAPALAPQMSLRLATACAEGATPADRPTTLGEFLSSEADLLRAGAAASLAAIGGATARTALLSALISGASAGATAELIATLAEAEEFESAETLGLLLAAPEANPLTHWLAVLHLADHPNGEQVMRRVLMRNDIDPFTRGALAEALGRRGDPAAAPLLLQIADDRKAEAHLRSQAVLALGLLDQPATEPALLRLAGNQSEDDSLRGLAAEHLPSALSEQGRRQLRDMLRRERVPAPIVVGALRALKRVRDREALSLMLRYAQDETADVAQAAIDALAELGDASATPDLVRITLNANVDRAVRLEAVGALIRLGGSQFRSLLQNYLEQGALPLRLQAFEHLAAVSDGPGELLAILADREWPLLLRLRVVERFGNDPRAMPALLAILQDHEDDAHLRCLTAEAIGGARYVAALPALVALAQRDDTPDNVRLRCITAIGAVGGTASWLALSRLAENSARTPLIAYWATRALHQAKES